jgi:frataxin-like iron-binding protein CyaY
VEAFDKNSQMDIDYSEGILKIVILENKKTYVINRNSGNQKIWYSSPFSGADYFSFDEQTNKWINNKKEELTNKLFNELSKLNFNL